MGDHVGDYEPGELVLLGTNLPHCWQNQAAPGELARSTVIQWSASLPDTVPELAPLRQLLQRAQRGLRFDTTADPALRPAVESLPGQSGSTLYLGLLNILNALADAAAQPLSSQAFTAHPGNTAATRMVRVQRFVAREYHRKIFIREVAAIANLTEQSFSRYFTAEMGRPFVAYLNEYRISVAGRLLRTTNRTVADIAESCGYESISFFYSQFRKYRGGSPGRFRR